MQNYIERKITPKLDTLLDQRQVLVITGMRRVGKTTQLNYLFDKIQSQNKIFVDLEDVTKRAMFRNTSYSNIKLAFEKEGIDFEQKAYIFIDEIQLLPEISSIIKYFYDHFDTKFVVSGSSSYYIKNHFTESLAGRKFVVELHPLTFGEFLKFRGVEKPKSNVFDISYTPDALDQDRYGVYYREYMTYGGFPDVVLNPNPDLKKEILKDIINSYFQIDITTLADFSDIGILHDLLLLLTQRIGQRLNITSLASTLKITRQKVYEYIQLLKSTYVIQTISQKSSIDNQVSADDKLYFCDIGMANIWGNINDGSRFENSIFMNLVYDWDLTYFKTKSGGEIDFVLNQELGLEVKLDAQPADLATLRRRAETAGLDRHYLVSLYYSQTQNTIMAWDL